MLHRDALRTSSQCHHIAASARHCSFSNDIQGMLENARSLRGHPRFNACLRSQSALRAVTEYRHDRWVHTRSHSGLADS